MKTFILYITLTALSFAIATAQYPGNEKTESFDFIADRFADIQVLRYRVADFDRLSLQQKTYAYYLYEAGLAGRDIFYDQKYKHGLLLRKTIEGILNTYSGERTGVNWDNFMIYCKRFFFANGNHHHYSADKFVPSCSFEYFSSLVENSDEKSLPLSGKTKDEFLKRIQGIIFDPTIDSKVIDLSAADVVQASCNNFYEGVTQKEAEEFYKELQKSQPENRSELGLNTKLVKDNGKIREIAYKKDGMYGPAIGKICFWLNKAIPFAENDIQKQTIKKLLEYYNDGDTRLWDEYNVTWVKDSVSDIDFVNGFIEVYVDALGKKGAFESIVSMRDRQATKRIAAISHQAQWFEDHSTILPEHKKKDVVGISAKVITVISEVGDAAPSTPIGINLPNNEWIREEVGSKSVSLGNIVEAYNYYRSRSPMINEFGSSDSVIARVKKFAALAGDLHTDMHEVIGHASGKINEGVGSTDETLKNYAGVLEEARADLVGLYFVMDPKLIKIGVMPSLETGKAGYDNYILNGLMTQLQRIEPGKNLEEAHMRNRQLNASWAFEKGKNDKVIEKVVRDGKTYFVINDYGKLRTLFGDLLREIQRIKSEGDFEAGKALVENYGVKVDQQLLSEVHKRFEKLDIAPYQGFIQPKLTLVIQNEKITDVKLTYPESFVEQMLEYGKDHSFLPVNN